MLGLLGVYMEIMKMVPPNSSIFNRVFHYFHHPFWGTPIFGNHWTVDFRRWDPGMVNKQYPWPLRLRTVRKLGNSRLERNKIFFGRSNSFHRCEIVGNVCKRTMLYKLYTYLFRIILYGSLNPYNPHWNARSLFHTITFKFYVSELSWLYHDKLLLTPNIPNKN